MSAAVEVQTMDSKTASKLFVISYHDTKKVIKLTTYADTIILEPDGKDKAKARKLAGIRMGGYPESVRAMADAIYGGGTITITLPDEREISVLSLSKRYSREFRYDGTYAEVVMLVQDETEQAKTVEVEDEDKSIKEKQAPRSSYIYCEPGDCDGLFREIDRITSAPLIPAFQDYVLSELQDRGILRKLEVLSFREKLEAWKLSLTAGDANIFTCINDGIRSGRISIPGSGSADAFGNISTMSQYLNAFGVQIAERIRDQFEPLFDPAIDDLSPAVLETNSNIHKKAGYSLYPAQLAAAEALRRRLKRAKFGLLIAECGSGKTKIGSVAINAAMQSAVKATQKNRTFNIVLCPSHVQKKWAREIHETIPLSKAVIVKSITELNRAYDSFVSGQFSCYIIMSKEKARDGYMRRPVAMWNQRRNAFLCPDCGQVLEMEVTEDSVSYKVNANHHHYRQEHSGNRVCEHCKAMLWEALNPDRQSPWVKVADYGFVHREFAKNLLKRKLPGKVLEDISAIAQNPHGHFAATGAYRRYALSSYIKNHMRGKIDCLIMDELHRAPVLGTY